MEEKGAKRGSSRFLAGLPSVLHDEGADHPCEAHNLSRTGVLLVGTLPTPKVGASVHVTLRTAAGDLELAATGRVTRVIGDPQGEESQVAVEFLLDGASKETLELLIARVVEGGSPAVLEALPRNATAQQIRNALEKVPLPHRVALAARGMTHERELVLHDPSPQVIEALVRNPHLLQTEVRAILRLPTLSPQTLEVLSRDPRWHGSEELKVLIASHHAAPFSVADRLASAMSKDAVRKLLQHSGLNPAVREKLVRKFKLT